jgi:hypothetical protein
LIRLRLNPLQLAAGSFIFAKILLAGKGKEKQFGSFNLTKKPKWKI